METRTRTRFSRLAPLVIVAVAMLALCGCAKKSKTDADAFTEAAPPSTGGTVIVERPGDATKRYYRDTEGKLYYVDSRGALHVIERTVAVETGPGGLYYVIEDEPIEYRRDDMGRIRFIDRTGRTVYIEEGGPGQVIDPLPILRGSELRNRMESGRSVSFCESEWKKCLDKCDKVAGSLNKKHCFENCDFQKAQCAKPY